jgi:hypothetical protein
MEHRINISKSWRTPVMIYIAVMMKEISTLKTRVNLYEISRRKIPDDTRVQDFSGSTYLFEMAGGCAQEYDGVVSGGRGRHGS